METITSKKELVKNIQKVEAYLNGEEGHHFRVEMVNLIRRGRNFVRYRIGDEWHFVPSKYIGYKDNTVSHHIDVRRNRLGGITDDKINEVLGHTPRKDDMFEMQFIKFCNSLYTHPYTRERDYWDFADIEQYMNLSEPEPQETYSEDFSDGFKEGKQIERIHKTRERNKSLIEKVKKMNKNNLVCSICDFDFEKVYGNWGKGFIEAHHIMPLHQMKSDVETKIEDILLVCSNCHRMLHRNMSTLSVEGLKSIVKKGNDK